MGIKTFITHHYLYLFFLGYPHWVFVVYNYLILFSKKDYVRSKLSNLVWIQYLIFSLVIMELIYEFFLTELFFKALSIDSTVLERFLTNFLIDLEVIPKLKTFF